MNGELHYLQHRWRHRIIWGIIYALIFAIIIIVLYWVADQFRSHTLPVGNIDLNVTQSRYMVGEPVNFSIQNKLNTSIYVTNKCPSEPLDVYRLDGNTWVRLHDTRDVADCNTEQRQVVVPAGSTITGSFEAWPNLFNTPGTYRLVAVVENYNSLPYVDFDVAAPLQQSSTTPSLNNTSTQQNNQTQIQNLAPTRLREPNDD